MGYRMISVVVNSEDVSYLASKGYAISKLVRQLLAEKAKEERRRDENSKG